MLSWLEPWINEIASSYDDFMSVEENICRRQPGQQTIARWLRETSDSSGLLKNASMNFMTPQKQGFLF